jgi:microcystin degradation protein MlrC
VAFGIDDVEGDILSRAREIVGKDVLLAATLDPHSHLTHRRFDAADLLVAWKEFPHVDIEERSRELVALALRTLRGEVRPVMAKHDCRMIASLPTTQAPIRKFVDKCMATEHQSEMSSLSTLRVHPGA